MLYFQAVEPNRQRLYARMATRIAQTIQWKVKRDGSAHFAIYNPRVIKAAVATTQGVAEGGAETSWSNDIDTITLQDILELTKHIQPINLQINDNLKSKLLHWDGNPEEIERVNQVTVSNQFPILIMVDQQGQIQWILDGNHRLHKAIRAQAKTIPAKLIRPSDLSDKARKIFNLKEQGVAEGTLNEYRNALYDFVKSKFPTWPEYVLKDFLYAQAKGIRDQEELKDFLDRNQKDFGQVKWRLEKLPITLDIFTPKTQQMIKQREGGKIGRAHV